MDSLQGIPVEYKLDTFNMPRTGTTLCHPQNWLCRCDAQLSSRHLALNSPLGHFNGDNAHSPQIPDTRNSRWLQSSIPPTATWLSLNYSEHNPSHVRRHTLPSQTSQPSHKSISSPCRLYTHNLVYETCSTNTNYIFHAASKNYS